MILPFVVNQSFRATRSFVCTYEPHTNKQKKKKKKKKKKKSNVNKKTLKNNLIMKPKSRPSYLGNRGTRATGSLRKVTGITQLNSSQIKPMQPTHSLRLNKSYKHFWQLLSHNYTILIHCFPHKVISLLGCGRVDTMSLPNWQL